MERPGAAFRSWDFAVLRKANAEWTQTISWLLLLHWFGAAVKPCQAADATFPRVVVSAWYDWVGPWWRDGAGAAGSCHWSGISECRCKKDVSTRNTFSWSSPPA
jgi:hypothetical protein